MEELIKTLHSDVIKCIKGIGRTNAALLTNTQTLKKLDKSVAKQGEKIDDLRIWKAEHVGVDIGKRKLIERFGIKASIASGIGVFLIAIAGFYFTIKPTVDKTVSLETSIIAIEKKFDSVLSLLSDR